MRITIASRIFEPEPSAASFRLNALAEAFTAAGHNVTVDTVQPVASARLQLSDSQRRFLVKRHRVLRDKSGYVRGYLQYLSFDIPLFFRILFGRRTDLIVVEPPPTTGFFVRIAAKLRRTPYVYYAADVWADAASQTGSNTIVVKTVRFIERWVWKGAHTVLSVSTGVTNRLAELGVSRNVITMGNGVDIRRFSDLRDKQDVVSAFVYPGTASEWHGAELLVESYAAGSKAVRDYPLVFIGGGSEKPRLQVLARELGIADRVQFIEPLPAEQLAPWLAKCVAAIATLRPGSGYDFAFPTKLYSAAACGAPIVYAGPGPAVDFVNTRVHDELLGQVSAYEPENLTAALNNAAAQFEAHGLRQARRESVRKWAAANVHIDAVAAKGVSALTHRLNESSQGTNT